MTEVIRGWDGLPSFQERGSYVTWGVFDGVHRGHQQIVRTLVKEAGRAGVPSVVLTFDPSPDEVLRNRSPELICSVSSRERHLSELGPDYVGVVPFTSLFSSYSPEEFYTSFLCERLHIRGIVLGEGARFGNERQGDIEQLRTLSEPDSVSVHTCSHLEVNGERVSSTRVREAIRAGALEKAEALLGRRVSVSGTVVRGQGRGRDIGYPTANLDLDHDVYPPRGIYGGSVTQDEHTYPAVASIGVRPTFQGESREVVEVHLLDFEGDLYDERITFCFHCFLREEEQYEEVDELVEQIERDIQNFREHPSFPDS